MGPLICATLLFVTAGVTPAEDTRPVPAGVQLLRYPFPYQAAVTVASDTHHPSVETFEAVHALINTRTHIGRGSALWSLLFSDPEIDRREAWRSGIDGFDLPIADSCWLYDPVIGVFERFDEAAGLPVPHSYGGVDFRDIIASWIRKGWVDTLHTPGGGDISRRAAAAGFQWLTEDPHRRLRVWSNHSYTGTPICLAPRGPRALPYVLKNIVKIGTATLSWAGLDGLARRFADNPFPSSFPAEQKATLLTLQIALALSAVFLLMCATLQRLRNTRNLILGILALAASLFGLWNIRLNYCQGDNPGSRHYCADLARGAGLRYYWLLPGAPDYEPEVLGTLVTHEWRYSGRPSFLNLVTLDDGVRCLAFERSYYKNEGGLRSLELLTEEGLTDLCRRQGTAILYTHWSDHPHEVFSARGLDGLDRLRRFRDQGRVWVAKSSDVLHHAFIRTFLEYSARQEAGGWVVEIGRVLDPTGDPFVPAMDDLAGVSFEAPDGRPVAIRVGGTLVESRVIGTAVAGGHTIVWIRYSQDLQLERTSVPGGGGV